MHENAFADATRPTRCVILNLELKPYSIGHDLILLSQRNPIAIGGFDKLPIEKKIFWINRAVLTCYRTWTKNFKKENNLRIWNWRNRNADYEKEIRDFEEYRQAGITCCPTQPSKEAKGRAPGCPFHAALIQFVVTKLGKSEVAAYDYPLSLAKFHYYTYVETEVGGLEIPNAEEIDFDNYCVEQDSIAAQKVKEAKCQA